MADSDAVNLLLSAAKEYCKYSLTVRFGGVQPQTLLNNVARCKPQFTPSPSLPPDIIPLMNLAAVEFIFRRRSDEEIASFRNQEVEEANKSESHATNLRDRLTNRLFTILKVGFPSV